MLWHEHRRRVRGLADVVPWVALVDEGVVLNADGTLTLGWSWHGPDLESATAAELLMLSKQLNSAFGLLDQSWLFNVDAIRSPAAEYPPEQSAATPAVLRLLDRSRAAHYSGEAHFVTRCYAALTYCPPADGALELRRWLVTAHPEAAARRSGAASLEALSLKVRDIEGQLGTLLRFRRLDGDGLLTYLHACASGLHHPVRTPPMAVYLGRVLASQDFLGGRKPELGGQALRAVAIVGFPAHTYPVLLDRLNHLRLPYRWSTRWLALDAATAREEIRRRQRTWFRARSGLRAMLAEVLSDRQAGDKPDERLTVDPHAEAMTDDAAAALAAVGAVGFGYYTSVVLVQGASRGAADNHAQRVANEVRALQLTCRVEENNAVEAFLGSLPGDRRHNVRRPLVSTRNLADLLPVSAPWVGPSVHPSPLFPKGSPPLAMVTARGGSPFHFCPWEQDVGHTLVVGATGAGKSTLLAWWVAQFAERYAHLEAQVVVFDKGLSLYPVTRAAEGEHYEPGAPGAGLAFAPLAGIGEAAERGWAALWLEELLTLQGITIGPEERNDVARALTLAAEETEGRPQPTLSTYRLKLARRDLREALAAYTLEGLHGQLLDAKADGWRAGGRFHTVEMSHLAGEALKAAVYRYLFHRIDTSLDGRPTLVVIDEAWSFLANPIFAEKIRQWLKELRKRNAAVVLATQSISDITESAHADPILESCPSKIYLPTATALTPKGRKAYGDLGLNERQIEMLGAGTKKRDYYLVTPDGRRQFTLDLSALELAFYGVDPKRVGELRTLETTYGADWPARWLRANALEAEAQTLETARAISMVEAAWQEG